MIVKEFQFESNLNLGYILNNLGDETIVLVTWTNTIDRFNYKVQIPKISNLSGIQSQIGIFVR